MVLRVIAALALLALSTAEPAFACKPARTDPHTVSFLDVAKGANSIVRARIVAKGSVETPNAQGLNFYADVSVTESLGGLAVPTTLRLWSRTGFAIPCGIGYGIDPFANMTVGNEGIFAIANWRHPRGEQFHPDHKVEYIAINWGVVTASGAVKLRALRMGAPCYWGCDEPENTTLGQLRAKLKREWR